MARVSKQEQTEAREALRSMLQPGQRVYCIVRHVARSGMSRAIDLYVIHEGELRWISRRAALALGWGMSRAHRSAIHVDGCGMDMCFHTVYSLSAVLFGHLDRGGYQLRHETI